MALLERTFRTRDGHDPGRNWLAISMVMAATALMLGAAACGGGSKKSSSATPTTSSGGTPSASAKTPSGTASDIAVNLLDYQIQAQPPTVPAGTVTFNAKNIGGTEHELVVLKTDLAPKALPTKADGSANEEGAGITHVDEIESLEAGGTRSLTVNLDAGHYLLICNVILQTNGQTVSHYAQGMAVDFTVTP